MINDQTWMKKKNGGLSEKKSLYKKLMSTVAVVERCEAVEDLDRFNWENSHLSLLTSGG